MSTRKLKIFTWHIHGSYLYYLSQGNYEIYIPVTAERMEGYVGRGETFPFGNNVIEVPASMVRDLDFDVVLFQTNKNYLQDQFDILSEKQQELPAIYLEHDPPRQHPTDTRHIVNDSRVLVVHVTHFNKLMWDNGSSRSIVIDHGVIDPMIPYSGEIEKGIVVINNLPSRGRLLGLDIFNEVRKHVPLDLVGMGTGDLGLGEVLHPQLPEFISHYRFFFNPIRYTSLGLAVLEALIQAVPVVGLATTEMSTVIRNGENGILNTNIEELISGMRRLLDDKNYAESLGRNGRATALQRFNIQRFINDWENVFDSVIDGRTDRLPLIDRLEPRRAVVP
jgi:glycosyltransferase involved in cell wall biosynthesis